MKISLVFLFLLFSLLGYSQPITLTVHFSGSTFATSSFAPVKYNKQAAFLYEVDDRLPSFRSVYAVMHGGVDPFTGKTFSGYNFTDGCGNSVGYRAGMAINIVASGSNQDLETLGGSPTTAYLSWSEIAGTYIPNDFCPMAHGWQHNESSGWPGLVQNVSRTVLASYDSTNFLGHPFVIRNWITPNADAGYLPVAESAHMLSGTSTNDLDGYSVHPSFNSTSTFTTVGQMNQWGFVFEKRDYTSSNCRAADVTYFNQKIDNLLLQATASNRTVMRFFSHQIDSVDGFNAIIGHLYAASNDRVWVCSAPEFFDYLECTRRYQKTETYAGSTLTITLDASSLPDAARFRDMSLLINTDGVITSVSVTGADSYSWSATGKLINVFKKKTTGFVNPSAYLTYTEKAPFPFNPDGFWSNNKDLGDTKALYDGDLTSYYLAHSSIVRSPDILSYEFPDSSGVILDTFLVRNGTFSQFSPATTFYAERKMDHQMILLGSFDNSQPQNSWTAFMPPNPLVCVRIVGISAGAGLRWGTEWKAIVDRTNYQEPTQFPKRGKTTVEKLFGVNLYPWDLYDNGAGHLNHPRYDALASYKLQRLYLDRYQVHPTAGEYAFAPLRDNWNLDSILINNTQRGITTIVCLKDTIQYTYEGWPHDGMGYHPPRVYGSSATDPASYINFGVEWWQLIARYGSNATISLSKLHPYISGPSWTHNTARVGLNTRLLAEPFNEPDIFWSAEDYMTGDEIAAMLSACYDGDMGRLGDTVGIKNADPNVVVLFSGLATPSPSAVRDAIHWSMVHRGFRADGSVNVPWDALNFHEYSTDGAGQHATASHGLPEEMSGVLQHLQAFVHVSDKYLHGMPVYKSEFGADTSHLSVMGVPFNIGAKLALQIQADWLTRAIQADNAQGAAGNVIFQSTDIIGGWEDTLLTDIGLPQNTWTNVALKPGNGSRFTDSTWIYFEFANTGIKDLILRAYPVDANTIKVYNWSAGAGSLLARAGDKIRGPYYLPQQFNSMGVLNQDESARMITNFTAQITTLLSGYTLQDTTGSVYHYQKTGAHDIYSVWSPTMSGATKNFVVPTPNGGTVVVHSLSTSSTTMGTASASTTPAGYSITATETPTYVEVIPPQTPGTPGGGVPSGTLTGHIRISKHQHLKLH